MPPDEHDWRKHEGGYPWADVDLPCRRDPELLDGLHVDKGVEASTLHCLPCPVRRACLAYALEHNVLHGTWGATSGDERRATLRRLRQKHGR